MQTEILKDKKKDVEFIKIITPDTFIAKVRYICSKIYETEWSGVLFYSMEGDITEPDKAVITLEDILLLDKGSKTFTKYELDKDYINYLIENPNLTKLLQGHIHSHNTMDTFFSATDTDELKSNAVNHNFYLSVIVNNFMSITGKIGYYLVAEEKVNFKFFGKKKNGENYLFRKKDKLVKSEVFKELTCKFLNYNLKENLDENFTKQIDRVLNKKDFSYNNFHNPYKNNFYYSDDRNIINNKQLGLFNNFDNISPEKENLFNSNLLTNKEATFSHQLDIFEINLGDSLLVNYIIGKEDAYLNYSITDIFDNEDIQVVYNNSNLDDNFKTLINTLQVFYPCENENEILLELIRELEFYADTLLIKPFYKYLYNKVHYERNF